MKQKRVLTILMMAVLACSVTACGDEKEPSQEETMSVDAGKEESEDQEEEPEEDLEAEEPEDVSVRDFQTDAAIEETVLVDENDIKITATDLSYDNYSAKLNLVIENNSDKNLSFVTGSIGYSCCAINGYMIDNGYLNADVAAGKKSNETISFDTEALLLYGITQIADIQIGFDITDEDYTHEYVNPVQIKTSAADTYDYETDTYQREISSGTWEALSGCSVDYYAEEEIYSEGGARIESAALVTNKDGERIFLMELVNEQDQIINGSAGDIAINGLTVQSYEYSLGTAIPGTRRVMMISMSDLIDEACLEPFGISDIEEFACTFMLEDNDNHEIEKPKEISVALTENMASIDDSGEELYNEDGIRIVSKGLIEGSAELMDDIHILLLVENQSAKTICIDEAYGSLSINGFMVDASGLTSLEIDPDKRAVFDVAIYKSALEDNRITDISDIAEAELTLEITDQKFNTIAEPAVKISF